MIDLEFWSSFRKHISQVLRSSNLGDKKKKKKNGNHLFDEKKLVMGSCSKVSG